MELIVSPPQVAIKFRVSLVHSIMTVLGLLHVSHRLEGLSDWLRQAEGRLNPETAAKLNFAAMFTFLATGVQGYLIDSVPSESGANDDFDALWQHLNTIDTRELQKVAFSAMRESMWRHGYLENGDDLPTDRTTRATLINHAYHELAARWDPPLETPMNGETFSDNLDDPTLLHKRLLESFHALWTDVYHGRANEDQQQHRSAVEFHNRQSYPSDLPSVFRAVTGRTMPDWLKERASRVKEVVFVPGSHMGAHFTISIFDKKWWVGFNANLVPAARTNVSYSPEMYPALKALADETRLKIVALLTEGEFNVGEIAEALNLTQSTASRHLSLLARTELLSTRRDGTMRYYTLNSSTLQHLSERLGALARLLPK